MMLAAYTPRGNISIDSLCFALTGVQVTQMSGGPHCSRTAKNHGVSSARVILTWHLSRGVGTVPSSKHSERQVQNINVGHRVIHKNHLTEFSLAACSR